MSGAVRSWTTRSVAVLLGAGALLVASPGVAGAHPLGNFTLNRYSGVVVSATEVTVDHVLDIAEIPTAQRSPAIDSSGDGTLSRAELATWAGPTCADAARSLHLTVAGDRAPLTVGSARVRTLPGQAGLPVLRVKCLLRASVPVLTGPTSVRLVDTAGSGEVGWKEVTAVGDGTTLTRSDVPRRSGSDRLVSYPEDLLSNPLDVASARLAVRPGGPALQSGSTHPALPSGPLDRGADRLSSVFEGLLRHSDDGPLLGLVALLGAVVLGAAHAVAPGHGKTIMAFYLSGRREGSLRAAATVGATVTATHTAGVLALGLVASAGTALAPAKVYPWLGLASGLLVVVVGLGLLRAARRGVPGHTHGTGPGQHTHPPHPPHPVGDHAAVGILVAPGPRPATTHPHPAVDHAAVGILVREDADLGREHHDHPHDHDHDRDLQASAVAVPSRRGLVAIGLAGGLLPSPSALIVFLGALALGRPWFGIALVVAFGMGMAATLALVGLLVMRLREGAERRLTTRPDSWFAPLLRIVPLATAAAVIVLGAMLAARGFSATGIL